MSWSEGYVSEIDYTHGYYRELSPCSLQLSLLSKAQAHGIQRPLCYLELGFGQGLSLNIHAASTSGEFWGTDFNPSQAANAREMASACGSQTKVLDDSFAELAGRDDLPEFDIIALHGIWSWISDENRRVIVDIARRKLAVGGAFCISYNCTPGWAAAMPLRHLMTLHAELATGEAYGMVNRIESALGFVQNLVDANAHYFLANPSAVEKLKRLQKQSRNYLAHEYFNADWHPMPFSGVAEYLANAKLTFAASNHLLDHVDTINLTVEAQKILAGISHPILRESVRDYCINRQFRKDIFIKGARPLPPKLQVDLLLKQRFALLVSANDVPLTVSSALGEGELQKDIYQPIIEALGDDVYRPKSLQELMQHAHVKHLQLPQIFQALLILCGNGHAGPAQDESEVKAVQGKTAALNAHLIERAKYSSDVNFLASPVIGGGVPVGRFQQLFLRSIKAGKTQPAEWAREATEILFAEGHRMVKDGKPLESAEKNLAELTSQANEFQAKRLPLLKALLVV